MDVLTVFSQVNEQLSKALDLTQLLETVVGIVKDLTQFHRVLVYQFDEAWNGQVSSRASVSRRADSDVFPDSC
jgi:light-regulated signal transduction histidine kinase (bacteriophytochrome)